MTVTVRRMLFLKWLIRKITTRIGKTQVDALCRKRYHWLNGPWSCNERYVILNIMIFKLIILITHINQLYILFIRDK